MRKSTREMAEENIEDIERSLCVMPGLEEVSCGGVLVPKKLQASILEYV